MFPHILAYLPLLAEFESSQSHLLHPDPRPAAITSLCSCPKQAKILEKSYSIKGGALTLWITPLSCPEPSSVPPQALAFICKPQKLAFANLLRKKLMGGYWVAHEIIRRAGEPGWEQAGTKEVSTVGQCPPWDSVLKPATPGWTLLASPVLPAFL